MNVLGLIPARGGSKGIPRKNLVQVAGRPLIAYTIDASLGSIAVTRTVVSTDDDEIAEVSEALGAEIAFRRPAELASDSAAAIDVIRHAVGELDASGWRTDVLVYLQPTSPMRTAHHIDAAVQTLEVTGVNTVVSVVEIPHRFTPSALMKLASDGSLMPMGTETLRRQDRPRLVARNGPAVLAMRRDALQQSGLYAGDTRGLLMGPLDSFDVDEESDLIVVDALLRMRSR